MLRPLFALKCEKVLEWKTKKSRPLISYYLTLICACAFLRYATPLFPSIYLHTYFDDSLPPPKSVNTLSILPYVATAKLCDKFRTVRLMWLRYNMVTKATNMVTNNNLQAQQHAALRSLLLVATKSGKGFCSDTLSEAYTL